MTKTLSLPFLLLILASCSSKNLNTECFENRYAFKDTPNKADILNLSYRLTGGKVSGEYNWLPLEKDKRIGHFEGSEKNSVITAQYYFEQEGISDSTQIEITISDQKVTVKEPGSNFGFEAELSKVACQ